MAKLLNNEDRDGVISKYWFKFNGVNIEVRYDMFTQQDSDLIGKYKLVYNRVEDNQLNWSGSYMLIADNEPVPYDQSDRYFVHHANVEITDLKTVKINLCN